jgi:hypothetical protein
MCLSSIYNASRDVHNCVAATEEMSTVIQKLQTRHGVQVDIPFVTNSLLGFEHLLVTVLIVM